MSVFLRGITAHRSIYHKLNLLLLLYERVERERESMSGRWIDMTEKEWYTCCRGSDLVSLVM